MPRIRAELVVALRSDPNGPRCAIDRYGTEYGATCSHCPWRRRRPTRTQAIDAAYIHLEEHHR